MKQSLLAVSAVVASTASVMYASPSLAARLYDFSFVINEPDGNTETVMGRFTTENDETTDLDTGFTGFLITSITGTANGTPIDSLLPPGDFGPIDPPNTLNNNLFNPNFILGADPNDAPFDIKGLGYTEGGTKYQLFYDGQLKGCTPACPGEVNIVTDFEATLVPEPSSILGLVALGTLGLASSVKRKLKSH